MPSDPFDKISKEKDTARDRQQERLESKVENTRDKRSEERFGWVFLFVILADFHFFPQMQSWSAPVTIGVLQIFFLMIVGASMGIDDLAKLMDRVISAASDALRQKDKR